MFPCAGDLRLFRDEVRGVTVYQITVPLLPAGEEGAAAAKWLMAHAAEPDAPLTIPPALAAVKGADEVSVPALLASQMCEVVGVASTNTLHKAATASIAESDASGSTPTSPLPVHPAAGAARDVNLESTTLGLHVLAVDDERSNRLIMKRMLDRLGCTSVIVTEGDEAIEELQRTGQAAPALGLPLGSRAAAGRPFDVVLMDVVMKRTDGITTCIAMRDRLGITLPIIATSGNRPKRDDMIGPTRFTAFVQKPFTLHELAAHLTPIPPRAAIRAPASDAVAYTDEVCITPLHSAAPAGKDIPGAGTGMAFAGVTVLVHSGGSSSGSPVSIPNAAPPPPLHSSGSSSP